MDMRAGTEESAFREYKERPTPERLTALLTAVQDRIYNICFQILRRSEDAEDACQEILIELTRGLSSLDAPRPFKVWLYRVAVHTALDRKEARGRQARLAQEASTAKPEGTPMIEAERDELMRAIRTLDDRTRCMVLEHYFDKLTLEEIGAREGVSAVAVFKRLDRARETLRRALLGAGFTVAAAGIAQSLEAVAPVAAPASMAAKSALIAGGVVMGTKSAVTAGTMIAALLLVGAASTGGYLVGNGRSSARVRELQGELDRAGRAMAAAANTAKTAPVAKVPPPSSTSGEDSSSEAVKNPAVERTSLKDKEGGNSRKVTVNPETVRYGRPLKPDQAELLKAETWDDFYKKAKDQKHRLGSAAFEDLIFQRVIRELKLDAYSSAALRALFDAEREETTRVIVESAGGPAGFAKMMDAYGMNWKALHGDWQRLREDVRQAHNYDYLKSLTFDQLAFFNEHLRNSEIGIEASYGPEYTYYLITGVGKPQK